MNTYFQLISLLLLLLISCGGSTSDVNDTTLSNSGNYNNTTPNNPTQSYTFNNELVWSDEFDQDGPVSQDKWNVETIPPNNGSWWNGELQFYTDKEDNIRVEEGLLKITAKYESYEGKNYTSARINTQDKFEFIYGRVEMRAKLPNWEGMWPAFWLLGANIDEIGWPNCGELDILEHGDYVKDSTSNDPGLISSAVHYGPQDTQGKLQMFQAKFFLIQVKKDLSDLKK